MVSRGALIWRGWTLVREAPDACQESAGGWWRVHDGIKLGGGIRLNGTADAIQEVLNLARLLPDGIEGRRLLD